MRVSSHLLLITSEYKDNFLERRIRIKEDTESAEERVTLLLVVLPSNVYRTDLRCGIITNASLSTEIRLRLYTISNKRIRAAPCCVACRKRIRYSSDTCVRKWLLET